MMFEINLVPEIKRQFIKAQRVRNFVLFVCIIVSAAAILFVGGLLVTKGGQDIEMTTLDSRQKAMSAKLNSYEGLDEFLTIQDQLGSLSDFSQRKKVLSRIFSVLDQLLPHDSDLVQLSKLTVDLDASQMTLEGQADAREDPLIDYRVLEAFKKGVGLTKYDYGDYVDAEGQVIPPICITEVDDSGKALVENNQYYANWYRNRPGCDPSRNDEEPKSADQSDQSGQKSSDQKSNNQKSNDQKPNDQSADNQNPDDQNPDSDAASHDPDTPTRIYRTPQYKTWEADGHLSDSGQISGLPHFESRCLQYSYETINGKKRWSSESTCLLAPDGMTVIQSSNGRDEDKQLVLRFTASFNFDPEVFLARNHFMTIIGTHGQNVTDSFVQIGNMFTKRAEDCAEDDETCQKLKTSGAGSGDANPTSDASGSSNASSNPSNNPSQETPHE